MSNPGLWLSVGVEYSYGWIKLHRKIRNNWIWKDPVKFQWWVDILLEANHKETKMLLGNETVLCDRGQTVRSLKGWADRWMVSRGTVRSFLQLLENDGMITVTPFSKSTRITICNYDSYQDVPNSEDGLVEPEKKVKSTTKRKKDERPQEIKDAFKKCVDYYFSFYEDKVGIQPTFSQADGNNLHLLITRLKKSIESKGNSADANSISNAFNVLLQNLPEFYMKKLDIKIINSKYDAIIAEIRSKHTVGSKDAWADVLARRSRERETAATGD